MIIIQATVAGQSHTETQPIQIPPGTVRGSTSITMAGALSPADVMEVDIYNSNDAGVTDPWGLISSARASGSDSDSGGNLLVDKPWIKATIDLVGGFTATVAIDFFA